MFMSLDYKLDDTVGHGFSAIVWVCALNIFVFVFKAFYFAEQYPMYIQEKVGHNPCHRTVQMPSYAILCRAIVGQTTRVDDDRD